MEDFIPNPFFKKLMSVIYSCWRQRKLMVNHRWDTIFHYLLVLKRVNHRWDFIVVMCLPVITYHWLGVHLYL